MAYISDTDFLRRKIRNVAEKRNYRRNVVYLIFFVILACINVEAKLNKICYQLDCVTICTPYLKMLLHTLNMQAVPKLEDNILTLNLEIA